MMPAPLVVYDDGAGLVNLTWSSGLDRFAMPDLMTWGRRGADAVQRVQNGCSHAKGASGIDR